MVIISKMSLRSNLDSHTVSEMSKLRLLHFEISFQISSNGSKLYIFNNFHIAILRSNRKNIATKSEPVTTNY